ncbi:hypothetical protein [Anaerorhabdus sp.]|uniref:hypothetical protein n=1 Tax=Anaerorhabdus sp. TaxID=1872524 RepID=UPI003A83957D
MQLIETETDTQINDLRNGLKIFSGRYNKGKEAAESSDNRQNQRFKNMLRFSFMKKWNIHYNLGVYFDAHGHIVGNTQILDYFFNCPFNGIKEQQEYAYNKGKMLGEKSAYILRAFCNVETLTISVVVSESPKTGYRDLNTNRKSDFFLHPDSKESNLIILHILSSIGFVTHLFCPILPIDNKWAFRIKYVAAHYAWSGLKKMSQHFSDSGLETTTLPTNLELLIENGAVLFPSTFRNCMMHYDLCVNGVPSIKPEYFDTEKMLFGLVESCFDGKGYYELAYELDNYLHELENCLTSWFRIDMDKIKWD